MAEEILAIFRSRDLECEAIAALIAFRQAASLEVRNAQLVAEIQVCLDQARQDPHAPLRAGLTPHVRTPRKR